MQRRRPTFKRKFRSFKGSKKRTMSRMRKRKIFKPKRSIVRKMVKQLQQLPTPLPARLLDILKISYLVPAGQHDYTGLGHVNSGFLSGGTAPFCFTSSPEDLYRVVAQIAAQFASPAIGASKYLMQRYRTKWGLTNPNNFPIKATLFELRVKRDIPAVWSWAYAAQAATGMGTVTPNLNDSTIESWINSQMVNQNVFDSGSAYGGKNITDMIDVTAVNPVAPATNNPSGGSPYYIAPLTQPGVKLKDCRTFANFFKFVGIKSKVLQPGQAFNFVRNLKKPYIIDTRDFYQYAVSGGQTYQQTYLAIRGQRHFMWKFESVISATTAGGSSTHLTYPAFYVNMIQEFDTSISYLNNAQAGISIYNPLATDAVGSSKVIFPGSSTAGVTAPAI